MNGRRETADEPVEAAAEGTGAKDASAPVKGVQVKPVSVPELLDGMSEKQRKKWSKALISSTPDFRKVRRDRVRAWLTGALIAVVFLDGGVALGLAIADAISWDELKDWLTLALVPLTPAVAVAIAFWFPTKETE